jgi:hypothetical protein
MVTWAAAVSMASAMACRLVVGILGNILGMGSSVLVSLLRSRTYNRWLAILSTLRDTSAVMDTSLSYVLAHCCSELVNP